MDQMGSAIGGIITIDFFDKENPVYEAVDFDFASAGYALCIVDSRSSHADLTDAYASIPVEMKGGVIEGVLDPDAFVLLDISPAHHHHE